MTDPRKVEGASSSPKVGGASSSPKVRGASSSPVSKRKQPTPATTTASSASVWDYFNPMAEIDIRTAGNLPHWEQGTVWYFITFRLADALPRAVVEELSAQRERWRQSHDVDNLSAGEIAEYHRLFSERYENLLNAGSGSCLLRDPENADIVRGAFRFFEGQRYLLDEHVVMPNHVHLLVKPIAEHKVADILHSWKSFSANKINRRMKRTGSLWQHESYDHIVRNESAMHAIRRYIRENPGKVGGASSSPKVGGASSSPVLTREQDAPATLREQDAPATLREQDAPATLREQDAPATLPALYTRHAKWWPLLSPPEAYREDAAAYTRIIKQACRQRPKTLLELGSGGGSNAWFMKRHFQMTLSDLSADMLAVSRALNPDCEHVQGDMRTLRLDREFDAVFVHDAIVYMRSRRDLLRAVQTAYVHCRPGGVAVFAPDYTRESFHSATSHGGEDTPACSMRYLQWDWDPDPADSTYRMDFVYLFREADNRVHVEKEHHIAGLFSIREWYDIIRESGFEPDTVTIESDDLEPGAYRLFVARKAGR